MTTRQTPPRLPRDMLAEVYAKADARTKARLRTVNKAAAKNALMPPAVLKKGYAFGTGRYQKAYNTLDKWFAQTLETIAHAATANPRRLAALMTLRAPNAINDLFRAAKDAQRAVRVGYSLYRGAVRDGEPDIYFNRSYATASLRRDVFPELRWGRPKKMAFYHPDREAFMDAVLRYGIQKKLELEQLVKTVNVTDANRSQASSYLRYLKKRRRVTFAYPLQSDYVSKNEKRAERIARRAARRLA